MEEGDRISAMDITANIFVIAQEALTLNHASILHNDANYCSVNDDEAGIYYICLATTDIDVYPLIEEGRKRQNTVTVISETDIELRAMEGFSRFLKVRQYAYHGPHFEINAPFKIEKMTLDDFGYLSAHYMRVGDDDAYLKDAIKRGMLKAVDEYGEIMGFIGEHPEHALGMLYVDENHRRKGVGSALEKALINKFLDEGKLPFDHVVIDNYKSMSLQQSLGMTLDAGCIYWYF